MINTRFIAAQVITKVLQGKSLGDVLQKECINIESLRDKAFIQTICYGVCRDYSRLNFVLHQLLKKPLPPKEKEIHALLLVGLYQLMAMRVPAHAAISETVNASKQLDKPWASGLTNAILREYERRKEAITNQIETNEEAKYDHPTWFIKAIKKLG